MKARPREKEYTHNTSFAQGCRQKGRMRIDARRMTKEEKAEAMGSRGFKRTRVQVWTDGNNLAWANPTQENLSFSNVGLFSFPTVGSFFHACAHVFALLLQASFLCHIGICGIAFSRFDWLLMRVFMFLLILYTIVNKSCKALLWITFG